MRKLQNFVTKLHTQTTRDYLARMVDDKVLCMNKAKEYEFDYWDGDRRFGYGGYKYIKDRWKPVAESLIKEYNLTEQSSILDVGCGKGFLLYEIKKILPKIEIYGFDISKHGLNSVFDEIKENIILHDARKKFPYKEKKFDLTISLATLHNLSLDDLFFSLSEINRVSKKSYIMVESFRDTKELFNLQCWALTCETFFQPKEWIWLFDKVGLSCDYEFIYFE